MLLRLAAEMFSVATMVLGASVAAGQDFPIKPLRIVTGEIGGSSDFVARLIAQGLSAPLGQTVIVNNRPSNTLAEYAAKATPDGYTLLVHGVPFLLAPLLRANVGYDAGDFAPISMVDRSPLLLVVHPSLPVKSVTDLIALAKAKPGELNFSTGSTGGTSHLAAELFKSMAGINIVRIGYKGGGTATSDLIGGRVQLTFGTAAAVAPNVQLGKLRLLAVTTSQPSALFPKVLTVAASGLPGYESAVMTGMFAPSKTPSAIVNRVSLEVVRVLNNPDLNEKFLAAGIEIVGSSREQFAVTIKSEMARMGKVIKDAGIHYD